MFYLLLNKGVKKEEHRESTKFTRQRSSLFIIDQGAILGAQLRSAPPSASRKVSRYPGLRLDRAMKTIRQFLR